MKFILFLFVFLSSAALAHDLADGTFNQGMKQGPSGEWCCGAGDCFEVASKDVRATPDGYLLWTIEQVPYVEVIASDDGKYWRCQRPNGSRRCFFAPPPNT